MMQQVTSDVNKSRRTFFAYASRFDQEYLDCLIGNQLRQNIQRWLAPPDPWENYNIARETHHDGTATWFIGGSHFEKWKSLSSPLLWIHGKRSCLLLFGHSRER